MPATKGSSRAALCGRLAVSLGAFVSYPQLLALRYIYVPDDRFTSDIFYGEFPARVFVGQALRHGELPVWTRLLGHGYPLGAGLVGDPVGFFAFALFPPAIALSVFMICVLLIAAHGAYSYCRELGATIAGSVFAGVALAGSGYFVSQLRHLSIMATVAWLPWGMLQLHRAFSGSSRRPQRVSPVGFALGSGTLHHLTLFGLVLAAQALAGFPQSLYICCNAYAIYGAVLLIALWRRRGASNALGAGLVLSGVSLLGALAGSLTLMPLLSASKLASRDTRFSLEQYRALSYRVKDMLNFVVPAFDGDASDGTWTHLVPYWEVYGYSGLLTLAAFFAAIFWYRKQLHAMALLGLCVFGMLSTLGPAVPWAFDWLSPITTVGGMFRFPTRYLILVHLPMAMLAGLGVSHLQRLLLRFGVRQMRVAGIVSVAVLCVDLFVVQRKQNPFVPADTWLKPPSTLKYVDRARDVVHAPLHNHFHKLNYWQSAGWQNLDNYYRLRAQLPPNLPLLWRTRSVDLYSGFNSRYWAWIWGDQFQTPVLAPHAALQEGKLFLDSTYVRIAETFGVTRILSPVPVVAPGAAWLGESQEHMSVYAINGRQARIVPRAVASYSETHTARLLASPRFDPDQVVIIAELTDADNLPSSVQPCTVKPLLREISPVETLVHVAAGCGPSWLFLAESWYPGWEAQVNGAPAPVHRANLAGQAVRLPGGATDVRLVYTSSEYESGGIVTCSALAALFLLYALNRARLGRLFAIG